MGLYGSVAKVNVRSELSLILGRARAGDERARGELVAYIYGELRRIASRLMGRERTDHTLSPTALVHEAVIRLMGEEVFERAADRSFLLAAGARAMREVLIDHARRRAADRRGGGRRRVPLDLVADYFDEQGLEVVAVHEALDRLAELNERQSQVMTLRYFGGMTVSEVAAALGVSVVTVERDWRIARRLARRSARRGRQMTPDCPETLRFDAGTRPAKTRMSSASRTWLSAELARAVPGQRVATSAVSFIHIAN